MIVYLHKEGICKAIKAVRPLFGGNGFIVCNQPSGKEGLPMETLAMVFLILVAATCYIRNYDRYSANKKENHNDEDNKK